MAILPAVGLLVALVAAPAPPPTPSVAWPPVGSSWSRLRLEARKAVFRGSVALQAERIPSSEALTELRAWPEGAARNPGAQVTRFRLQSKATFRGEGQRVTWADAGGLLQDDGREGRRRSVRRFSRDAFHQWRDRGKEPTEERHVALEASDRPVVDVGVLLWLATGLRLDREAATLRVAVVSRGRLVPLDVEARETATLASGGRQVVARRVLIRSADEENEASLFGLRGDVDLWLDTASGMPVEMRGTIAKLGAVRVRVVDAVPEAP